jgi:tetratricopeptide (TPR) repeat protein
MRRDSWVFGLAGVCFGLLIGWIIGTQNATAPTPMTVAPAAAAPAAAQSGTTPGGPPAAAPLDETKLQALRQQAEAQPKDAAIRGQIGNLYFDAERYPDAIAWYEQALAIDPKNADVSTDLGVSYYYTNQTDRALQQFQRSLDANPRHTKTILNIGMVKAFGKQDLLGAAQAWQQVVEIAPDTPEGRAARQALESLKAAHPDPAPGTTGAAAPPAAGAPAAGAGAPGSTPKGGP